MDICPRLLVCNGHFRSYLHRPSPDGRTIRRALGAVNLLTLTNVDLKFRLRAVFNQVFKGGEIGHSTFWRNS